MKNKSNKPGCEMDKVFDKMMSLGLPDVGRIPSNIGDGLPVPIPRHRISPTEILKNIDAALDKKAKAMATRVKREKQEIVGKIGREGLFRLGYVPFVIGELVWDYADTVLNIAATLNRRETVDLGRAIRKLRREYQRLRGNVIGYSIREREINNMYVYEDAVNHILKTYQVNLKCELSKEHPTLSKDSVMHLVAVFQCYIVGQALIKYTQKQQERLAKIVGHTVGDILPSPLRALPALILEYAGDKAVSEKFKDLQNQYILTLANQMGLIKLDD